jgi:arylsulfatase A-like enzyme
MQQLLSALAVALLVASPCVRAVAAGVERPNVVFILADDFGWRDLGCYGSTYYQTPNLDRLAARGVRFTQAYAANPLCSPTRSSILTGLWPARTGITAPVCHVPQVILEKGLSKGGPGQRVLVARSVTRLKTDYATLPKVLHDAGYRTGHFGKWHLGAEPYSPLQQGYDVDWPHWPGPGPAGSYVAPWKFPPKLGVEGKPGEHIEDTLSQHVVDFIHENKDRPFFASYWQFSVHAPYDAKDELVAKYRKLVDPKNPQRNPVYAAMVESLDDGVGRVVAALEHDGLMDKTIIVFFSDNGGVSWGGVDSDTEGRHEQHKSARFQADMHWAPTSNLPLRNGKASLYEGGTREPCVVIWPGVTKGGTTNDTIIQSIDWMPTILEMVGVPLPAAAKPDGISVVPALRGGTLPRDAIFCHFPHDTHASGQHPGTYVRRGAWKLIRLFAGNEDGTNKLELYNLEDDLGETMNRAADKPELVRELNRLIDGFLKETNAVIPVLNPAYKAAAGASRPRGRRTQPGAGPEAGAGTGRVLGWSASKDARITAAAGELRLTSTGGDPYCFTRDLPPGTNGPFALEFSMKSDAKGEGQVFFTSSEREGFGRGKRLAFAAEHDGAFHDYKVALDAPGRIYALRIDPATAPGDIVIRGLVLRDAGGRVVKTWAFTPQSPAAK